MKTLGIIRKIDELGRVVIPAEIRRAHGWDANQPMEMFMDGNSVVMKPYGQDLAKLEMISQLQKVDFITENAAAKEIIANAIKYIEEKV
ncbi:MAG: AbrB/MazE/SpoVT family DNA-binding domain-containing protein [Bacillus sp. (in: firmicutes)]